MLLLDMPTTSGLDLVAGPACGHLWDGEQPDSFPSQLPSSRALQDEEGDGSWPWQQPRLERSPYGELS